jgi:hypothetical protein
MPFDRKSINWKDELEKRQKEAYRSKDDSGRFKPVLKALPDGYEIWKCTEGEHLIDVIPYLASENNPNNTPVGNPSFKADIWVHSKIGPNEDNYVCLARTLKKDCPICQHKNYIKESQGLDEKDPMVKSLNPSRRIFYNVWVHDNEKEETKGPQVWEVSQFLFEQPLINQAQIPKIAGVSVGGSENYTNPDTGKMISFTRKGKTQLSTEYVSFHFIARPKPIPDEILMKSLCLDDFITIPTYEEVYKAYHSEQDQQDEAEATEKYEPPAKTEEKDIPDFPINEREARRQARLASRETQAPLNPCPHGHKFGNDIDAYDECVECTRVEDCEKEADIIKMKQEEELKQEIKKEEPKRPLSRRLGR